MFFASSNSLIEAIDYQDVPARVRIDVSHAHFWDITAIGALDDIVLKLRRHGAAVEVIGLNKASSTMVERFGTPQRRGAPQKPAHSPPPGMRSVCPFRPVPPRARPAVAPPKRFQLLDRRQHVVAAWSGAAMALPAIMQLVGEG